MGIDWEYERSRCWQQPKEDQQPSPAVPPVGEDCCGHKRVSQQLRAEIDTLRGNREALKTELAQTRQQHAEQTRQEVEKASAAERAEIAFDIAENPNSEWTKELRAQLTEKDARLTAFEEVVAQAGVRFEKLESREAALRAELEQARAMSSDREHAERERAETAEALVETLKQEKAQTFKRGWDMGFTTIHPRSTAEVQQQRDGDWEAFLSTRSRANE